jgi:hypothetical protein
VEEARLDKPSAEAMTGRAMELNPGSSVDLRPTWLDSIAWACDCLSDPKEAAMNGLIYLIGLIVVVMFILSFLGLH